MLERLGQFQLQTAGTQHKPLSQKKRTSRERVLVESATLWTVTRQAPLSMGFSRQEYGSGLPGPPPGIFPTQGSNSGLLCLLCHPGSQNL